MNKIGWKKIHNILGLSSALFLLLLLVSGVLLNHPGLLEKGEPAVMRANPRDNRQIYMGRKDGLYLSKDRGKNWDEVPMLYPPENIADIDVSADGQRVLVLEKWGRLLASLDGGKVWNNVKLPLDPQSEGIELKSVSAPGKGAVLVLTSHGWLETLDFGGTWDESRFNHKARPLHRLVLTIHNGYFFGPKFVWLYDFAAASLLILIVSGVILWKIGRTVVMMVLLSLSFAHAAQRMEMVMGTLLQISASAGDPEEEEKAIEAGFREVRRWDELLSNYKEFSEISKINRDAYPESTVARREVIQFLLRAKALSEETSGYFEIAVEPLTRLWGIRSKKLVAIPPEKEIIKARIKSNSKYLEIYESDDTVRFLVEGAGIDTGGIGKGYALDKALIKMRAHKISSAILNFGGEIVRWPLGANTPKIAVKDPLEPARLWGSVSITGFHGDTAAVSTSANYERSFRVQDGEKTKVIGHIINTKTGEPASSEIRSVTVLSGDGARADALSTGLFAMGLALARTFALRHPDDWVLILYQDGSGELKAFATGGWLPK